MKALEPAEPDRNIACAFHEFVISHAAVVARIAAVVACIHMYMSCMHVAPVLLLHGSESSDASTYRTYRLSGRGCD